MTRTWLVTGSSRGIGRSVALAALAAGDNVLATARNPAQLAGLESAPTGRLQVTGLDVNDPQASRAAVDLAVTQFGRLDVVVNNAGYANSAAIELTPMNDFRAQVETNFFGVVHVTQAALPIFRRQRAGHFIQISSIGGRVGGSPGLAAYQASKFAVEGFSEVLNAEVAPFGVKVSIIEPGGFRTEWGATSMRTAPVDADYEPSVGAANRRRQSTVTQWAGDPERAAAIIVDLTRLDQPPLRLLLGAGAVESARASSLARAAEADQWEAVSRSADFPSGQG